MLDKVKAGWNVLQPGQMVLNPAAWKNGQVKSNMVVAFLAALAVAAKVFLGYDLHLDDATLQAVGVGLFALVNWLFTAATSDKIGVTGKPAVVADVDGSARDPALPATNPTTQAQWLPPVGNQSTIQADLDLRGGGG